VTLADMLWKDWSNSGSLIPRKNPTKKRHHQKKAPFWHVV